MSVSRTRPRSPSVHPPPERRSASSTVWALARINLGLGYLWTFLDLTFGLGWHAPADRAWLTGNSPIRWSLANLDGPLADLAHPLAGHPVLDLSLMVVLFLLAAAFTLGVALRTAAVGNAVVLGLSALVRLPDSATLLVNTHLMLILLGFGLAVSNAGELWGAGRAWRQSPLVRRLPWLR
ncbi:hypothetical protein NI17_016025 [Thermobifida halotolerans]|uniref:Uncharacterized protein n=1 Tax=Thermobifida halotolerans TaxID=483545 RepID=A0A399G427_9ACTN|nr:hypothetical protein [Thermobifida halotolerans]UOE18331.1 hypothetical protein NI17_016025 [Thermobifida halotolerans]